MTGGRVAVLGKTGRNFAAGMSGGVAYVWNQLNNLDKLINKEMVELEELSESDAEELLSMINRHFHYTESKRAAEIINNWAEEKKRFVKVISPEYKRALKKLQEESVNDNSLEEVING
jgi:glutamate synthase domain-containing protein 3